MDLPISHVARSQIPCPSSRTLICFKNSSSTLKEALGLFWGGVFYSSGLKEFLRITKHLKTLMTPTKKQKKKE